MLSYALFLVLFLVVPLVAILFLGLSIDNFFEKLIFAPILALIALIYTTPWDNYLVENRVWYYDNEKVLGITIGFVPLEEYLFFILQPFFSISVFLLIEKAVGSIKIPPKIPTIWNAVGGTLALGVSILGFVLLLTQSPNWIYLALIISWAFIPISLQLFYGLDLLTTNWLKIGLTISLTTIYLSLADMLAIADGVWTINPDKSLSILFFGILPLEEILFFLVTNVLVINGFFLLIDVRSRERWNSLKNKIRASSKPDPDGIINAF
ncbi:MAG: lycopene cyclase domain-containing protein [Methanobacteriota archaeon]|nr:MAG: lycopene cyclase domain-containing protein [Euryarchaeota archaeon]